MDFEVATYNVLAQVYCAAERYPRTPAALLQPVARRDALIRHVAALGADIICLQEVEREAYEALAEALRGHGYSGHLAPKGLGRADGCATFFSAAHWQLIESARYPYQDEGLRHGESGHVAELLMLARGPHRLGLANTHLKWDPPDTPEEASYGCLQIEQLLAERERRLPGCDAWIVCGDLNVQPDSEVVDRLRLAGLRHAHDRKPAACTSNAGGNAKVIDYLFYSAALRASPRPVQPVSSQTPLPGPGQPSDHVVLQAGFAWN